MNPSISLAMIVRNEAKWLPGCLESVRGLVSDIQLVDTGSTDGTVALARRWGADVQEQEWQENFSFHRNAALERCTGDWILQLDADERLLPEGVPMIRKMAQNSEIGGWAFWFRNLLGNESESYVFTHRAIRLWKNDPGVRFTGRIHEQIGVSLDKAGYPLQQSAVTLLHLGYQPEWVESRKKTERTIRLCRLDLAEHPEDDFQWFNLGNAYYVSGDFKQATEAFAHAIQHLSVGQDHARMAYVLQSACHLRLGWIDQALQTIAEARQKDLDHPALAAHEGDCWRHKGDLVKAVECFDDALSHRDEKDWLGDKSVWTYKSEMGKAVCYHALAQSSFAKVRKEAPGYQYLPPLPASAVDQRPAPGKGNHATLERSGEAVSDEGGDALIADGAAGSDGDGDHHP